ncbi:carbonyl reductase family member 4 [Radiomyces spectabilis]|uniref:carbonyl reductase family member 4 n=1 Tax=Radiomyces spectabilis TaxID=64574 RepID=UPI00221FDE2A|nr:carbonyl reductase family member 4 [Radiomyces spectabilis]KAI8365341.1 carbonyl reductase family member 4 [Radiomyces spectabilis]
MSLAQKTAIITGATRGIGFAIADAFAKQGAQTILIGRNPEHVRKAEQHFIEHYGNHHRGVVLDVGNMTQVDSVLKTLTKDESISCLVNAAGISRDGLLLQMRLEDLHDTINTNLLGTMRITQHVAKSMLRKRKGGCIINIASVIGIHGNVGQTVYSASKAGLIGFTKSLAKELGPSQIRVNAIAPGFIETDMTAHLLNSDKHDTLLQSIPLRRFGQVDDVAEAALFVAKSQYLHGHVLNIDGGLIV